MRNEFITFLKNGDVPEQLAHGIADILADNGYRKFSEATAAQECASVTKRQATPLILGPELRVA